MTDLPPLEPRAEELLGKHLLGEASAAEEEELRAETARSPRLAGALELLRGTAPALEEAGLAPHAAAAGAVFSPDRLGELVARVPPFAGGPNPLWLVFFWAIILVSAVRDGWSLATLSDPLWWWIPGLAVMSAVFSVARRRWIQRRLDAIASGGPVWAELVEALDQEPVFPWGPLLVRALVGGALFILGLLLFASTPLTLGLAEGYRQLVGLGLVLLSSPVLTSLHREFLPIWVRALDQEERA